MGYGGGYATGYTDIPPTPETLRRWNGTTWVDLAYLTEAAGDDRYALLAHGHGATVADHEAAADPHPLYLTQAEGDARYPLAGHGHPASGVTAGTFGAGDYVFPAALDVTGVFRSKTGSIAGQPGPNRFWGGLELAHPSSTPYIDFHRSSNPEEATDFNVRFVCRQNLEIDMETASMPWAAFRAGHAQIGSWGWDNTWVHFGHKDRMHVDSASYQVMVRNTGEAIINAPNSQAVYIRQNAGNRFQVDSQVHTSVRLNVTGGLYLWSDWIRIGGSAASNGIHWEAYGGGIFMQDTTWVRIYGGKSFFTAGGQIRTDGKLVASAQNGSTGLWLYNDSDAAYRVYFDHGTSGTVLVGWNDARCYSTRYDVMLEAGRNGSTNRHVNGASNAWRYSDAQGHTNMSDPRFKRNMRQLPRQAEKVRAIRPLEFQWDEKHDIRRPGTMNFGFSADDLPPEVIHTSALYDETTGEPHEVKMMDPVGVLAMLWKALLDVADDTDADRARQVAIEKRLAAIEKRGP